MKYEEAMDYIANTSRFGMNFGLERVQTMLALLGNPEKKLKCIHIAGTNGKGSTTAMVTSILREEGYTVGMYTSPYLEEFEERIQINGVNIPKEKLVELVDKIIGIIDRVVEQGFDNPTQFEIITTIMFLYFANENVDYVVLEVGLGGRLDATNVIKSLLSAIASISFDHVKILGNTIAEIANEKCGIIKDALTVSYPQVLEAMEVIEDNCNKKGVKLIKASEDSIKSVSIDKDLNLQTIEYNISDRNITVTTQLLGEHQIKNTLFAINIIDAFSKIEKKISDEAIIKGIRKTKWIGRMEIMKKNPLVVIDGAHNIDGIKAIKNSVEKYFNYNKIILILGILSDKDVEGMVKTISELSDNIILTEPHSERAGGSEQMISYLEAENKHYERILEYDKAYERALEIASDDDLILICGSLYMIGDMRKVIRYK
ncbi:MAG: bifunctional folylpolyglutamate synthase/dihydrofolate synthase [Sarcina sp.]